MSILTDKSILSAIDYKTIVIEPFDPTCLGPNSYDVHLYHVLATYQDTVLDCKRPSGLDYVEIPEKGLLLKPNELYLGRTLEYTETHNYVPVLEGKSSLGRLGLTIHVTAGLGDAGFCNYWTLEIVTLKPLWIYPNMPIGQLVYHTLEGTLGKSYQDREGSKYNGRNTLPVASKMHQNKY